MKIWGVFFCVFLLVSGVFAKVMFTLEWGNKKGQVGYYNASSKGYNEFYPLGPQSIKFIGSHIWILDSFNNKVLVFSPKGKLYKEINFGKTEVFINDFAYDTGEKKLYLLGEDGVYLYDGKAKRLLPWHIKRGGEEGGVLDPRQIIIKYNRVFIYDKMREKVLVFFKKTKKLLAEWDVSKSGIAVYNFGVYFLKYIQGVGYKLFAYDIKTGKLEYVFLLGIPEYQYGRIIGVSKKGIFIRALDNKTKKQYGFIFSRGVLMEKKEYPIISPEENIFFVTPFGKLLRLDFNAEKAPAGKVKVIMESLTSQKIDTIPFQEREGSKLLKYLYCTIEKGTIKSIYFDTEEGKLYTLTDLGLYKEDKMICLRKNLSLKSQIVDFIVLKGRIYFLQRGVKGKEIVEFDPVSKKIIDSFPPYVEEEPLFYFPDRIIYNGEDGLIVIDSLKGRMAYFDPSTKELLGVRRELYDYIFYPYGYIVTLKVDGKKYSLIKEDNLGNVTSMTEPLELEDDIFSYSLWKDAAGEFYVFFHLKNGKNIVQKFSSDFTLKGNDEIAYFLPAYLKKKVKIINSNKAYIVLGRKIYSFRLPF